MGSLSLKPEDEAMHTAAPAPVSEPELGLVEAYPGDMTEPTPPLVAKQRGVRAVSQTVLSRILVQGLNAGTGILTARLLLPAGRGELAAITLWSSFLAGLTGFGLPSSLIFYIRSRPKEVRELFGTALFLALAASAIAGVVGVFLMPHWLHQYPAWAIRSAQWFLLVTPLCAGAAVTRSALEATGRFSASNASQLLNPTVTLVILLLLLAVHRFNTFTAACAYVCAALPVFIQLGWQCRDMLRGALLPKLEPTKVLLSYGLRSYVTDILGTLSLQVDQVLVVRFLSPSGLGIYVVLLSLSRVLGLFPTSVTVVLFPKAAGTSQETAIALAGRATRLSTLLTGACALCLALCGPFLLRVFYGAAYAQATVPLYLLLAEVTVGCAVQVLAQVYMALGRPGVITALQTLGLALSVPLMVVLIPRFGITGAAIALLSSTVARLLFIYASFRVTLKASPPGLIPVRSDFAGLGAAFSGKKGSYA